MSQKSEAGIRQRNNIPYNHKIYWRGRCHCWGRLVVEHAGGRRDNATKKLRRWVAYEIDIDELFRPIRTRQELALFLRKTQTGVSSPRQDQPEDLSADSTRARERLAKIPSPTKWEKELTGQSTSMCLPGPQNSHRRY